MRKDLIVLFACVCVTKLRKNTQETGEEDGPQRSGGNSSRGTKVSMSVEFTSCQELFSVHITWGGVSLMSQPPERRGASIICLSGYEVEAHRFSLLGSTGLVLTQHPGVTHWITSGSFWLCPSVGV